MSTTLNQRSAARLKALIDSGKFTTDAWEFTPADANAMLGEAGNFWIEYELWHLATDTAKPKQTRDHYLYPFGKDGQAYTRALADIGAAAKRAGDYDVAALAMEQLERANAKLADRTKASGADQFRVQAKATITASDAEGAPRIRRFDMLAYTGGTLKLKGWAHPVVIDLGGVDGADKSRPIFLNHDENKIVGHADAILVDAKGIRAQGAISGGGDAAKEVLKASDAGFPWAASVGMRPDRVQFIDAGKSANVNGRQFEGPINIARKTTLGEISFVAIGADDNTSVRIAATANRLQQQSTKVRNKPMETIITDEQTNNMPDAATAERQRASGISKACAEYGTMDRVKLMGIQAKAISDGWTPERTELELIRADRPSFAVNAGGNGAGNSRPDLGLALTASMCMSCGMSEKEAARGVDERAMNAAVSAGLRGASIHTLIRQTIQAAGRPMPERINDEAIRTAFEADRWLRASGGPGYSTMSLSNVVANVQNKFLLSSYENTPTTWATFCAMSELKDFKPGLRIRLVGSGRFQVVPQTGDLPNMGMTDQGYSIQAQTEGAIIVTSRQMIINDDTAALTQIPKVLGREGAVTLEQSVFTALLGNANNFFGNTNKNYASGAPSALSISALTTAEQKMLEQLDENNRPVLLRPSVILVPPALKTTAENLYTGAMLVVSSLGATNARVVEPNANPFATRYQPVTAQFLGTKPGLTNSSDTGWYLMADPAGGVSPVEVAFVNGQRSPTIQTGEANFNTLGIATRAFFDFGVALQDHRGGVFNVGA